MVTNIHNTFFIIIHCFRFYSTRKDIQKYLKGYFPYVK